MDARRPYMLQTRFSPVCTSGPATASLGGISISALSEFALTALKDPYFRSLDENQSSFAALVTFPS
jgi:hypothetical protein